jgi:hypothetical protein
VPNKRLRHIRLSNNQNKPVTNSRDTQEVLGDLGKQMLKIFKEFEHNVSILDDFDHFDKAELTLSQTKVRPLTLLALHPLLRARVLSCAPCCDEQPH